MKQNPVFNKEFWFVWGKSEVKKKAEETLTVFI